MWVVIVHATFVLSEARPGGSLTFLKHPQPEGWVGYDAVELDVFVYQEPEDIPGVSVVDRPFPFKTSLTYLLTYTLLRLFRSSLASCRCLSVCSISPTIILSI